VRLAAGALAACMAASGLARAERPLDACLGARDLARVARVVDPRGRVVYARVTQQRGGHITRAATLAPDGTPLAAVFDAAARASGEADYPVSDERVCAVVSLPEPVLDAEEKVVVSTGLNYAAHAEEAGGGDVFLFPKPVAPTPPYARVHPPAGVALLDYEIELAFVLLEDVDPSDPPSREALLADSAFFVTNDISDREPIVRRKALGGPGTGFVLGKGQRGFLPAGPWMMRGSELFAAQQACGASGLGLRLWIGDEREPRQHASTARMILPPEALVARIGTWIEAHGRRTTMPFVRDGVERFYPLAVGEAVPRLPAGSIVQTGTPEGVALQAPAPLGVTLRGMLRLRGPFEQFIVEQKARVASGDTRYLAPGDVVRARIDGLGEQRFEIGEARAATADRRDGRGEHPCHAGGET